MIARLFLLAAVVFAAFAPAAYGETTLNLGKHDADAPIKVSADNFVADMNARTGTYSGNVVVTQGDFRLRADTVRIDVVKGKPDKIRASGHVVFASPSGAAHGDTGVYDVAPRRVTLSGHVLLTKDKNVMRGTKLTINLVTGAARLQSQGANGGRVQGLFTPPPQSSSHHDRPDAQNAP